MSCNCGNTFKRVIDARIAAAKKREAEEKAKLGQEKELENKPAGKAVKNRKRF